MPVPVVSRGFAVSSNRPGLSLLPLALSLGTSSPALPPAGPQEAKRAYESCYFQLRPATAKERLAYALRMKRFPRRHKAEQLAEARRISDTLERYIAKWLAGDAKATIPRGVLPDTIDNAKTRNWTLREFQQVDPRRQWIIVPARPMPLDQNALMDGSADPHATYLLCIFIAPLGSVLHVSGEFPHCRFMDYQVSQPFDPEYPTIAMGEVPIVDVDIEPDAGHVNPFRAGARRDAKKRSYHVKFEMKAGNAKDMNPEVMTEPKYRARGNTRVGGPFASTGALGCGSVVPSVLWLRYYAPDKGTGPLAGVKLPKVWIELESGAKVWVQADCSKAAQSITARHRGHGSLPSEPTACIGPELGWIKMFGIPETEAEAKGIRKAEPYDSMPEEQRKRRIRTMKSLVFRRAYDLAPPGNLECGATCCPYISYLLRPVQLGRGKVYAITGKLPTFPETRNGEKTMTKAQCRYWSIHHASNGQRYGKDYRFLVYGAWMDDEIAIDADRKYILVYSRPEDRPKNATRRNGVTWDRFGACSLQVFVIRWMSVIPDWHFPEVNFHADKAPWRKTVWSSPEYDSSLLSENRPGILREYHPVIHYMTKDEFEALGDRPEPGRTPRWGNARRDEWR